MNFKNLCEFFGGTIFIEESRGDLQKIGAKIAARRLELQSSQNQSENASVILVGAVWQMHCGEFNKAVADLTLLDNKKYGPRWVFRAKLYKAVCWLWENFPPLFKYDSRTASDGYICASDTGLNILGFSENWKYCQQHRADLDHLSDIDCLEFDLFKILLILCVGGLDSFRTGNPSSRYLENDPESIQIHENTMSAINSHLTSLQTRAEADHLNGVAAYLERIMYETARAAGDTLKMSLHLINLRCRYMATADWHGLGIYEMLRGDAIVSPDLTSPLMMNFKADIAVSDDVYGDFASQSWGLCTRPDSEEYSWLQQETNLYRRLCEAVTQTHPLVIIPLPLPERGHEIGKVMLAIPHYTRAITFFRKANELNDSTSLRGIAKAFLSLACIIRLHAWQPKTLSDQFLNVMASVLLTAAKDHLADDIDAVLSNLVSVHQLLSAQLSKEGKTSSRTIGRWLHISGNEVLGGFLGLLPYRMGVHFRYTCGDLHRAIACFDFSRQIFARHLWDRSIWSRVLLAESQCMLDLGRYLTVKGFSTAVKGSFSLYIDIMDPGGKHLRQDDSILRTASHNIRRKTGYDPTRTVSDILPQLAAIAESGDPEMSKEVDRLGKQLLNPAFPSSQLPVEIVDQIRKLMKDDSDGLTDPLGYCGFSRVSLMQEVDAVIAIDAVVADPGRFPDQQTISVMDLLDSEDIPTQWRHPQWQKSRAWEVAYRRTVKKWGHSIQLGDLRTAQKLLQNYLERSYRAPPSELLGKTLLVDILKKAGHLLEAAKIASQLDLTELIPDERHPTDLPFDNALRLERRKVKSEEMIFRSQITAGTWSQAKTTMEVLEQSSPGYFSSVSSYTQYLPWQRCLFAGLVCEGNGAYDIAWQYFSQAWAFAETLRQGLALPSDRRSFFENADIGRLINSRVRSLLLESKRGVFETVQPSHIRVNVDPEIFTTFVEAERRSHQVRPHPEFDALEILETTKAQYVSDMMLASSDGELDQEARELLYEVALFEEYHARTNALSKEEEAEYQRLVQSQGVGNLVEQRVNDLNARRAAAGVRWTLPVLDLTSLISSIPEDALVIYTSLSEDGLCIFGIETSGIVYHQWRSDLDSSRIREKVLPYLSTVVQDLGQNSPGDNKTDLKDLSDILLGPVRHFVARKSHIIFVPTGDLTRLPLGALLYEEKPLLLQKVVSQTPSLTYLHLSPSLGAKHTSIAPRASVVAKSGPPLENDTEAPLPFAGIEALMVSHLYSESQPLAANSLTRDEFRNEMETSTIVHLSTHGNANTRSPLMSSISLAEKYRAIELSLLRVRTVELAVFSACLTGQGQATPSGDILGFSHAMLASGANVYVGALWHANDVVTTIHMYLFHLYNKMNGAETSVAENWATATRQLYHLSHEDAANILKSFVETWDELTTMGREPDKFVPGGKKLLQMVIRRLGTRRGRRELNFKHPYFWAPFSVMGNGSLRLST